MEDRCRAVLHVLGDGATVDMARRVIEWSDSHPHAIPIDRIGGLAEVAALLGRNRQTVWNWGHWPRHRGLCTPRPFAQLAATPLFDLDQWRVWADGHAELTNSSKSGA